LEEGVEGGDDVAIYLRGKLLVDIIDVDNKNSHDRPTIYKLLCVVDRQQGGEVIQYQDLRAALISARCG
jgi:hypothetical protein